jgi:DNA polymerase I
MLPHQHIIVADFEFESGGHDTFEAANRSGERPQPVCMVAKELRSGQEWRLWREDFGPTPPFPIGPDALFVAYYASAELGCFKALGWPNPHNILDLCAEYRIRINKTRPKGAKQAPARLVDALAHFGLGGLAAIEKDEMRLLILRGGPWSHNEQVAILDYCATDTDALERLLPAMLPHINLGHALLRGRYMAASAAMEWNGVPIDMPTLQQLREHWLDIQDDLIRAVDEHSIYEGRTFKADRWASLLIDKGIPWPQLESGQLNLGDSTFRNMAKAYPIVSPYRELRSALSDLRLNDLAVGSDGRNRTILSAFRSQTGRNQPSNTRFIFGPSVWLRGLVKPPPGSGIAYVDWSQQEFGTAAALSGDLAMQEAYTSGDPYLTFAKQAGAVPPDATKKSHGEKRELFKQCVLGIQYGMESKSLALRIAKPEIEARDLLRAHRETYRTFWRWSDSVQDHAMLRGSLHTVFGWTVHVGETANPRSLRNFPMQANGAEMLRLACCLATERGIEVCAPVHDAVLICAPLDRLDEDITKMRAAMAEASSIVLKGFELRTDCPDEFDEHGRPNKFPHVIRYPRRYMDERGDKMWDHVMRLILNRSARGA